jgi:hypothetical protein
MLFPIPYSAEFFACPLIWLMVECVEISTPDWICMSGSKKRYADTIVYCCDSSVIA